MASQRSVPVESGFVITERGRHDLVCAAECKCNPRLVGLLIECPECGTIYGSLRDGIGGTGAGPVKRRWD
jgi:hypothetical protein